MFEHQQKQDNKHKNILKHKNMFLNINKNILHLRTVCLVCHAKGMYGEMLFNGITLDATIAAALLVL